MKEIHNLLEADSLIYHLSNTQRLNLSPEILSYQILSMKKWRSFGAAPSIRNFKQGRWLWTFVGSLWHLLATYCVAFFWSCWEVGILWLPIGFVYHDLLHYPITMVSNAEEVLLQNISRSLMMKHTHLLLFDSTAP